MAVAPLAAKVTRDNRQFLARAVTWAASQGFRQLTGREESGSSPGEKKCSRYPIIRQAVYNHSVAGFAGFFGALELVPPGVVDARAWRPGWEQPVHLRPRDGQALAGVARVG